MGEGVTSPREGLPPCWRGVAQFEGREVTWHDESLCPDGDVEVRWTQVVCATDSREKMGGFFDAPGDCSNGRFSDGWGAPILDIYTDDPDEAQAAFARGAEYVRTGVLE